LPLWLSKIAFCTVKSPIPVVPIVTPLLPFNTVLVVPALVKRVSFAPNIESLPCKDVAFNPVAVIFPSKEVTSILFCAVSVLFKFRLL